MYIILFSIYLYDTNGKVYKNIFKISLLGTADSIMVVCPCDGTSPDDHTNLPSDPGNEDKLSTMIVCTTPLIADRMGGAP